MIIYAYARRASSRQYHQKHDLRSFWDRINDLIAAEHRELAVTNPRSPRIRPSLAPVQWSVR
jgi:hypothetical protein